MPEGRSRRFLPGDPRVEEPYRLTPQLALRVGILGAVALAIFAVLFLRLWALQVLSANKYRAEANNNRVRTLLIEAPRGPILDRYGRVLVGNVPGTRVELWPADLPKSWPAQRAELRQLSTVTGVALSDILKKMRDAAGDPLTPIVVQYGIHPDQIDYIAEHQTQFPGVQLAESYLRTYPNQALAAHILGYVGPITEQEYEADRKLGYQPTDNIGQAGVESEYDQYLRGRDGSAQMTVDARGRPTSSIVPTTLQRPGNTLRLTIDIDVQRAAEKALKYGISLAHQNGEWAADGGAIVAMDPRDGSIIALASNPTYKPSVYVSRDPKKLAPLQEAAVAAKDNYPAIDRAISVGYPPGSTWKPVTALAAMETRILQPYSTLLCSPTFTVPGQTGKGETFTNWDPYVNQWIDLPTALAESCDTYFYQLGYKFYLLPPSEGHPLQNWASRFGFGATSGLDLQGEYGGLVPTPEWRRTHFAGKPYTAIDRVWKPGYSVQLAIGQGDLLVTPLQMARFYSVIANGGQLVTPHIAEDVEQPTGDPSAPRILERFGAQPPTPTGVDPSALKIVQQGLFEGTHSSIGTSSGVFGSFPVAIAGKTGTAQKLFKLPGYPNAVEFNQSWWCGYGPFDKPTIVVCAVIENGGHGGVAAAPAALKVFEAYFHKKGILSTHISD
ncbi:MAG: penicillin-binding protein 2 [Actinobacteria bacterium]|nr:penicillin-binding protein 2 [Actinomycetota bacterium]